MARDAAVRANLQIDQLAMTIDSVAFDRLLALSLDAPIEMSCHRAALSNDLGPVSAVFAFFWPK